jgi:hypothetical protein
LIVAVVVVAQAAWGMATSLCPGRPRVTIAILSAIALLLQKALYPHDKHIHDSSSDGVLPGPMQFQSSFNLFLTVSSLFQEYNKRVF